MTDVDFIWGWKTRAACKKSMVKLSRKIGRISLRHTKVVVGEGTVQMLRSLRRLYRWTRDEIDSFLDHRERYLRQQERLQELQERLRDLKPRRTVSMQLSGAQHVERARVRHEIANMEVVPPCGDYTQLRAYLRMLMRWGGPIGVVQAAKVMQQLRFTDMRTSKQKIHKHDAWRWLGNRAKVQRDQPVGTWTPGKQNRRHFSHAWKNGRYYRNIHAYFVWTCLRSALTPCKTDKRICDTPWFRKQLFRFVGMFSDEYLSTTKLTKEQKRKHRKRLEKREDELQALKKHIGTNGSISEYPRVIRV